MDGLQPGSCRLSLRNGRGPEHSADHAAIEGASVEPLLPLLTERLLKCSDIFPAPQALAGPRALPHQRSRSSQCMSQLAAALCSVPPSCFTAVRNRFTSTPAA